MPARLLFLLLCGGSLFAQTALQQAVELTRQGHYVEAQKVLEGVPAPSSLPQLIAFHRLKAAISSGLNEPALAAHEMEQALALAPADSGLLLAAAVAEFAGGLLDPALAHAQASTESPAREALVGAIEERRGQFTAAIKAYQAAVALAPDQEQYRLSLGMELIRHQQFEPAVQALKTTVVVFPRSSKIRTLLGIAQYAEGYSDDAVLSLDDAIAADPNAGAPYAALAKIVLQSSAVPAERTQRYLCAWNQIVCSAIKLRRARESGDEKMLGQASDALKLSAESDPIGRCELARAYEWQGNWKAAQMELERCVRLDPNPQNHYRLGLLYKRLGLTLLAEREFARRRELLKSMSEEAALGLNALEGAAITTR